MRLLERLMKDVFIAPREVSADSLGGAPEGFSAERRRERAHVIPSSAGFVNRAAGVEQVQTMLLLMPVSAVISVGDGVGLDSAEPQWRCEDVQRWAGHVAAQIRRIPC